MGLTLRKRGATDNSRRTPIPFNNLAKYASPGNPILPAGVGPQPGPNVAGNLIDPVAKKMMLYFPEPNITGNGIYDNWIGSGSNQSYNDQFDIKIDHRFNEKNLLSGKYSQQWSHGSSFNCFKNTHLHAQPVADHDVRLYARGLAYRRLQSARRERSAGYAWVSVVSVHQWV